MEELTLDQQKALILARARRRRAEAEQQQAAQPEVATTPADQDSGILAGLKRAGSTLVSGIAHPIETAKGLVNEAANVTRPMVAVQRAQQAMQASRGDEHKGEGLDPYLHGAVAALPFVGQHANELLMRSATDLSGAAAQAGAEIVGGKLIGEAATKANQVAIGSADRLYRNAIQAPPRTYSSPEATTLVETGLKERIPVGVSGLGKLNRLVENLNKTIEARIASRPQATVSPSAVAARTGSARAKAATQVTPEADVSTVDATTAEFLRQHRTPAVPAQPSTILNAQGQPAYIKPAVPAKDIPIPATKAQQLKKGTYQQVGDKAYGELASASVEAQKQLARGIKEELEAIFPEIKAINAREGSLLDLKPEIDATVNRMANQKPNLASLGRHLAHPALTSRIAIILHNAGVAPAAIKSRLSAYQALLLSSMSKENKEPETP